MMTQAHIFTYYVVAQANLRVGPQPNASTHTSGIQDFMRMNPSTLHGTKVYEDPQGFIYEIFKVMDSMGMTPREKAELAAYQLKMWNKCGLRNGEMRDP